MVMTRHAFAAVWRVAGRFLAALLVARARHYTGLLPALSAERERADNANDLNFR
ncbi:hypothetical protein [Brenneria roseae]|uniref:hypothetical protein n=1 Tax=Brenneria roseae TaxID=1509241 RepID=UPI00144580CC|nr:hypothetical protein [Brenneria roseae]